MMSLTHGFMDFTHKFPPGLDGFFARFDGLFITAEFNGKSLVSFQKLHTFSRYFSFLIYAPDGL